MAQKIEKVAGWKKARAKAKYGLDIKYQGGWWHVVREDDGNLWLVARNGHVSNQVIPEEKKDLYVRWLTFCVPSFAAAETILEQAFEILEGNDPSEDKIRSVNTFYQQVPDNAQD